MSRKKSQKIVEEAVDLGPTMVVFTEPDETNSARVRIARQNENKRWVTHGWLAREEATWERIAELFGGGTWIMQEVRNDKEGRPVIYASRQNTVPGAYRPPQGRLPGDPHRDQQEVVVGRPSSAPMVGNRDERIPAGVEVKDYMDNALLAKLLNVMAEKPKGPELSWLPSALTAIAPVIVAIIDRKPARDASTEMLIESLRSQVDRASAAPGPATQSVADMLTAMRELLGVRNEIRDADPEADKGGGEVWKVVNKALETFASMRSGTSVAPMGVTPANGVVAAPTVDPLARLVQTYGARLVEAATRNMDVDLVSDLVLQFVPDRERGLLAELVARPDLAAYLPLQVPALRAFPSWTAKFARALDVAIQGEDPGEEGGGDDGGGDQTT